MDAREELRNLRLQRKRARARGESEKVLDNLAARIEHLKAKLRGEYDPEPVGTVPDEESWWRWEKGPDGQRVCAPTSLSGRVLRDAPFCVGGSIVKGLPADD